MRWNEWLKIKTKMQLAISIKSRIRFLLWFAHIQSLLKWTEGWLRAYFKSETEVPVVDERKHSFRNKSTAIIFDKVAKVMNYLLLALTAYKAATQIIFGRLINGIIICSIFKPMFKPMFRIRK